MTRSSRSQSKEAEMAVFLTILKWVGIILLALLALILVILLIVLLVPIKYNARAAVEDPERHEEFPVAVLREKSEVNALISWLFGAVKILVAFPGDELIAMKVFGKDIGLMDRLKKDETGEKEEEEAAEEKEEEEKEETSLEKRLEVLAAKAEKIINAVDYVHRVLTGSCGRRAFRKVSRRLLNILDSLMPDRWRIRGNVGLNDPCLNGRFSGFTSILMPFMDEHLGIDTEWDLYRCNMEAEMDGKFRLITPLKETVPLVFDKDCRKVLKKLRKVKSKLQ